MNRSEIDQKFLDEINESRYPRMVEDRPPLRIDIAGVGQPTPPEDVGPAPDDVATQMAAGTQAAESPALTPPTDGAPSMTAYDPTTRERLAEFLQAGFESVGMERFQARRQAQSLVGGPGSNLPLQLGVADIVPFLGTGLQTEEAGKMLGEAADLAQQGDFGGAAINATIGALGLIPGAVGTVQVARKVGGDILQEMATTPPRGSVQIRPALNQKTTIEPLEEAGQITLPANVAVSRTVPITSAEKKAIETSVGIDKKFQKTAVDEARRVKGNYPKEEGWAPIQISGGKIKGNKFQVEAKKIPYNFHTPPGKMSKERWVSTMATRIVDEVQQIVDRAAAGDQAAINILMEANWYRSMRDRLRTEFGGLGDVFADILGTTSAQTGVEQNFDNAIEILRRFSRGEFDAEIVAYQKRLASGQSVDSTTLTAAFKAGEFPLITKAGGQLFNANSPAATGALLDMFRAVKAGDSPKTPNFTGNLIGLTNEATIDVWAARMLRRLSGQPTIPPPAEKGVAGKHLVGSDIYNPRVGSEFGFGQSVFKVAANSINNSGIVKNIIPDIGDLGPDDLQAVAWFIEKERWTRKGWTTKSGEGGSLDYEMNLAGQPEAERVKELRRTISSAKTSDVNRQAAQQELNSLVQPADRFTLGVSAERPGMRPSNYQQAELAAEFDDVVRDDTSVIGYKLTNTYGRFMRSDERALDAEFVVKSNFNPEPLRRRLVEMGKQYDQDAVFMSKVVRDGASPNARPGVEIYFKKRQGADFVRQITDKLAEYGVDGFTFVTDLRQSDRINVQAMAGGADTAGLTGVRFQYIPEFDDAFTEANRTSIMQQKEDLFQDIVGDILKDGEVSDARLVHYDTQVIFRSDYDEYLARTVGTVGEAQGGTRPRSADIAQSDRSGAERERLSRVVSNRLSESARKNKTTTVKRGQAPAKGAE